MALLTCPQCSSPLEGTTPAPTAKRPRFKWQESIRSLLLAMTILGLLLAWGRDRYAMRTEVQELKREIEELNDMRTLVKQARIAQLEKDLAKARAWQFPYASSTNALQDILKIGGNISIDATSVSLNRKGSDGDIPKLMKLKHLSAVSLLGDHFTDRAMEQLCDFPPLRDVYIHSASVTDRSALAAAKRHELQGLSLHGATLTEKGYLAIGSLTNLEVLSLNNTSVSDADLLPLVRLSKLRYLSLESTQVSDEGIQHLAQLKGLEELFLRRTQVTRQGVDQLKLALPDCLIIWE
jgi:hypothetical protein